jgi:hypothetical protein
LLTGLEPRRIEDVVTVDLGNRSSGGHHAAVEQSRRLGEQENAAGGDL